MEPVVPPGAVAIFVKTPGLSPVKTRLAQTIGRDAAEEFHRLSARAVEAVVRHATADGRVSPYWAVAERDGLAHPLWQGFAGIAQVSGGLGERLARVYDELLDRHSFVLLIGADAPQIPPALLRSAAERLTNPSAESFVLGRARDGGFYLFGGNRRIGPDVWCGITYSHESTADQLAGSLDRTAGIAELPILCDVDCADDLPLLQQELRGLLPILPEQAALLEWVEARLDGNAGVT